MVVGGAATAPAQGNEQGGIAGKRLEPDAVEKLLRNTDVTARTKAREEIADDPYRPLYHVSAPGRGLHDPAGLCWWNGYYHFFYLGRHKGVLKGWGRWHAVSKDLVHWQDLPPLPKEFNGGTGQALVDSDRVAIGLRAKNVLLPTSSDPLLLDWKMPDPTNSTHDCLRLQPF